MLERTGSTIVPFNYTDEEIQMINNDEAVYVKYGDEEFLALPEYQTYEEWIAYWCHQWVKTYRPDERIPLLIKRYEQENNLQLDEVQKQAVVNICSNYFSILTGGPGTGKTSVLKCVLFCIEQLAILNKRKENICLIAPTGKAARRMTEATGRHATTILGKIKYDPINQKPLNIISDDWVFVDESSMLDTETMYWLTQVLNGKCHLCLVGDTQQLPSVGKGSILRDLIQSRVIPCVNLTKTFRQKEGSTLLKNINIVREGFLKPFVDGSDFLHFEKYDGFLGLYYSEVKKRGLDNVCILSPTRKAGTYSSERLNHVIQTNLNATSAGVKAKVERDGRDLTIPFRLNDPVMQLMNREVANGEVGKIVDLNPIRVKFTDTEIEYYGDDLYQLDLAYAISIHKSQGSEYESVFTLCTDEGNLDRNMIYTAITRAKKQCNCFGKRSLIKEACQKQTSLERLTGLSYLL